MRLKFDGFIVGLILMIIAAYFYPDLEILMEGRLMSTVISFGVALIFFFYGLKLSFHEVRAGLKNWKLHLSVQLFTFALFPILVLLFRPLVQNQVQEQFWLSFYFLAALPSTVSSSVVMVVIAKGNIPAAIFNASMSGLIGVLLTPLLMQFFLEIGQTDVFGELYLGLLLEVILPVLMGFVLQHYWRTWAKRNSGLLAKFDKGVILLIVYSSFAESFLSNVFQTIDPMYLLSLFIAVIVLFYGVYGIIFYLARHLLHFNREDQITAVFCGSKKSLTHGSVFAKFLFANDPRLGLLILPLMIYHAFQIFVVTIIAQRMGNRVLEKSS
ncbi:MAG: bile acid:sodium symporter family protein [Sphingobacterium sp.]